MICYQGWSKCLYDPYCEITLWGPNLYMARVNSAHVWWIYWSYLTADSHWAKEGRSRHPNMLYSIILTFVILVWMAWSSLNLKSIRCQYITTHHLRLHHEMQTVNFQAAIRRCVMSRNQVSQQDISLFPEGIIDILHMIACFTSVLTCNLKNSWNKK